MGEQAICPVCGVVNPAEAVACSACGVGFVDATAPSPRAAAPTLLPADLTPASPQGPPVSAPRQPPGPPPPGLLPENLAGTVAAAPPGPAVPPPPRPPGLIPDDLPGVVPPRAAPSYPAASAAPPAPTLLPADLPGIAPSRPVAPPREPSAPPPPSMLPESVAGELPPPSHASVPGGGRSSGGPMLLDMGTSAPPPPPPPPAPVAAEPTAHYALDIPRAEHRRIVPKWVIPAAVVVVLLLAAGGAAWYFLVHNAKHANTTASVGPFFTMHALPVGATPLAIPSLPPVPQLHTISLPATLDGAPQFAQSTTQAEAAQLEQDYARAGITNTVMGAYRSGTFQSEVLALTSHGSLQILAPQLANLLAGSISSQGVTLSAPNQELRGGITYTCWVATPGGGSPVGLCAWIDGNVLGMVIDGSSTNLTDVANLTAMAKGSIEH